MDDLRRHAWDVLMRSLKEIATEDPDRRRKAMLAFWQGAGVYKGILEANMEERLQRLEEDYAERNGHR